MPPPPPLDSGSAFAQLLNWRGKQENQGLAPAHTCMSHPSARGEPVPGPGQSLGLQLSDGGGAPWESNPDSEGGAGGQVGRTLVEDQGRGIDDDSRVQHLQGAKRLLKPAKMQREGMGERCYTHTHTHNKCINTLCGLSTRAAEL